MSETENGPRPSADIDARRMACDGSRYCAAAAHWHGCFADYDGSLCEDPSDHARLSDFRETRPIPPGGSDA